MSRDLLHYESMKKSSGLAIALEILLGTFLGLFGIGNMYAGNVPLGIILLVSYWILQGLNICVMSVGVGFLTFPLVWLVYVLVGSITASAAVGRFNLALLRR